MRFIATVLPLALSVPAVLAKVRVAGVNIAGCDFGSDTSGNFASAEGDCPSDVGPGQMQHFKEQDSFNIFRLPVPWQGLVNNKLGGPLDKSYFGTYDALVQSCLRTGARCIVDIHNYARWNGGIIGQGGPSDEQFVNLWTQLARHYAHQPRVVMGIMNEPHDLNIGVWANTVQKVVTAIRNAGARSQWILLPGTDYSSAGGFGDNSGPYLAKIKNPNGSTRGLFFDVHQYYDEDSSGTHTDCVTNHIEDTFQPLADYLNGIGRKALLSETGGGNTNSCVTNVCQTLDFFNQNANVFLGWVGWAAGNFAPDYELDEVPKGNKDTLLVQKCIAGKFK